MMYASKIKIKRKAQIIREVKKTAFLPDRRLKIKDISKHVKEGEEFDIDEQHGRYYLIVYCYRYETKKELEERVKSQEDYNKRYDIFNAKYRR